MHLCRMPRQSLQTASLAGQRSTSRQENPNKSPYRFGVTVSTSSTKHPSRGSWCRANTSFASEHPRAICRCSRPSLSNAMNWVQQLLRPNMACGDDPPAADCFLYSTGEISMDLGLKDKL